MRFTRAADVFSTETPSGDPSTYQRPATRASW
jgi:hypothetical protein